MSERFFVRVDVTPFVDFNILEAAMFATSIEYNGRRLKIVAESQGEFFFGQPEPPIPQGARVRHFRADNFTVAYLIAPGGDYVVCGVAYCSPKDPYCYRKGRELALRRLSELVAKAGGDTTMVNAPYRLILQPPILHSTSDNLRSLEWNLRVHYMLLRSEIINSTRKGTST